MMHTPSFTPELSEMVQKSSCNYVVTGANGWLGRATLEMLCGALGDGFYSRVTALGSRNSEFVTHEGRTHSIQALSGWRPAPGQQLIVFHYAFLTKDKVDDFSVQDYIAYNNTITNAVTSWIATGAVKGVVLASSGAVYDHLYSRTRDTAAQLYGRLKYTDEQIFTAVCKAEGCSLIIPRIFNLSGPYINKLKNYALASFIVQGLQTGSITINARHPVLRSYYFVGDLIEICLHILLKKNTATSECFDVAGDEIVELGTLAQRVLKTLTGDDPQPVQRAQPYQHAVEDRYIGNRHRIQELENSIEMRARPLDYQIKATSLYIKHLLQQ
jgi:UDP-glucuronate decarboxylase